MINVPTYKTNDTTGNENYRPDIPDEYRNRKSRQSISKLNLRTVKKNYT